MQLFETIQTKVQRWRESGYTSDYPALAEILEYATLPEMQSLRFLRKAQFPPVRRVRGQFFCFARKEILLVVILATCRLYIVGKTTMEAAMFGNKHDKQRRLQRMADVIGQHPSGISQSALARKIGVPRCTVKRDLPTLEQRGILLSEDGRGWLSLFRRR